MQELLHRIVKQAMTPGRYNRDNLLADYEKSRVPMSVDPWPCQVPSRVATIMLCSAAVSPLAQSHSVDDQSTETDEAPDSLAASGPASVSAKVPYRTAVQRSAYT